MYRYVKRGLDIFLSLMGICLLLPLLLLLSLAVKLDSKGPVLFQQKRIGKDKKEFYILKFRTMQIEAPKDMPTHLLQHPDQYITKIGKVLRRTSLDELPQMFNILKGEMSLIGPRPALWNQEDLIKEREKYGANHIPVGLTGWAQIHGRDELSIEEKAKLDGEYAAKQSFFFDCKCLVGTICCVLKQEGILEGSSES
ncbi:MAG: sugar transferase [Lachnospiraceae bacterium]|nr:sugar transferase [Lachnospiraceae bacterium]